MSDSHQVFFLSFREWGGHVFFLSFTLSLSFILPLLLFVSVSQMNRPIQVKPADSESRGGTVSLPFLLPPSFPPSLSPFPLLSRPPQTRCPCTSASPLCVPLDRPCTSTRADSAAWPCPPVRTHYVNSDLPGCRDSVFGASSYANNRHVRAHMHIGRVCHAASTVNGLNFQNPEYRIQNTGAAHACTICQFSSTLFAKRLLRSRFSPGTLQKPRTAREKLL